MSSNSGSVAVRVYLTRLHLNKMIIPVIRIPVLEFLYVSLSIFFRSAGGTELCFHCWGFLSQRMVWGQENASAVLQAENTRMFIWAFGDLCFTRLLQSLESSLV